MQTIEKEIVKVKTQPQTTCQSHAHPVIFHELLQSKLSESDETVSHLREEAFTIIGASTVTTSWVLSILIYHLIAGPRILTKLKAELKSAISDRNISVPIEVLENLPYLAAVVKEALRLGDGVATRLQRVSPEKPKRFWQRQRISNSPPNIGWNDQLSHPSWRVHFLRRRIIHSRTVDRELRT